MAGRWHHSERGSGGATVTGDGTNSLTIAGTLADVNATLAGLSYTPAVNASG